MAVRKEDKSAPERTEGVDEAERTVRTGARMAATGMDQATDFSRRQAESIRALLGGSAQAYRDIAGDGEMDAILQTGARLARGMQDVGWEIMQFSQNSLRMQMKAANEIMTCRSIEDVVQVQRDLVRESVDNLLQESARLLEISNTVATEALDPLQRAQGGKQH